MKKILNQYNAAIGRNKLIKFAIASIVVGGIISGSWYLATVVFFPYAIAGDGTAVNPELQGIKPKQKSGAATSIPPDIQGQNKQLPAGGANQNGVDINQNNPVQQKMVTNAITPGVTNPPITPQEEIPPADEPLTYEEAKAQKEARYAIILSNKEGTQRVQNQPRIQSKTFFSYSQTSVYKIYCHEGYLTDIQLQAGEDIEFIGGGDTVRWIVDKALSGKGETRRWHVYVKPLKSGIQTNFIITTDRRAYQINARSTADFYVPIVGWNYPNDDKVAFMRQKEERLKDEDQVNTSAPEKFNFKYKITEEKNSGWFSSNNESYTWTPKIVFDDGKKTYIKMGDHMKTTEAPALFIEGKDGLQMVNYRVKGSYYIADRLISKGAQMINGKEIVYITRQK